MRTSNDPHNTLWTTDDRNPVTLAQIGRLPPGRRYGVQRLDLGEDGRGEHFRQAALRRRDEMRGRRP